MSRRLVRAFSSLIERFREFRDNVALYLEVTRVSEIARRYFVMNSLDGALTMLGVSIGAFIGGHLDPHIVLSSGLSGAVAIGLSGVSGAFLTEYAERKRELKEMERSIAKSLKGTVLEKSSYFAVILSATVDALAPVMSSLIVLSPYVLAAYGILSAHMAFIGSVILTLTFIWFLGFFLGKISKENPIAYGILMLIVGLITAFITYKLSTHIS
ncbi:MAG: hypothetical protein J7J75_00550 [Euryarchaeota archaeon]|nr:hypothetical protein [Euryarchaeota archaeon]MCD6158115.1 hypothetical protein [Euryarchaeota archaeon]